MKWICKLAAVLLAVCLLLPTLAWAEEYPSTTDLKAEDISADTTYSGTAYNRFAFLKDGDIDKYVVSYENETITLENPAGIAYLYLHFDLEYGAYTVEDTQTGNTITAGQYGILHELVDLNEGFGYEPKAVTLHFMNGSVHLSEITCYSAGTLPGDVQDWSAPLEGGADIVLFSAHSDDDQLFFAGLIPLYAGEMGCRVQVVLMTDHREGAFATNKRTHEILNGLWAAGLTAYPVFGTFLDYRLDDIDAMYAYYEARGTTQADIQGFVVEQLRRFKPLVAIGHDLNGEYGHGMHQIYARMVAEGHTLAADGTQFPESAAKYGTWQVQKTYLHLYEQEQILLDYDQPLQNEKFQGLTAFQVSQKLGYPCHKTQQGTWFTSWINGKYGQITKATEITTYNPAQFGLYASEVGQDVLKNDFLENIVTYAMQDVQAAEAVEKQLDALETVTLEDGPAIQAARQAYEALTQAQKDLVQAPGRLAVAEEAYIQLQEAYAAEQEARQQAIQAVIDQIDALGTITLDKEAAVQQAEAAYVGLPEELRAQVSNAEALVAARQSLQQLQLEQEFRDQQLRQKKQMAGVLALALVLLVVICVVLVCRHRRKRYVPKFSKK